MFYKGKWILLLFLTPIFILFFQPGLISAHSALVEAYPSVNSHLDQSPSEIRLKFNERLEKELYYIHVFDDQAQAVTGLEAKISPNQKELHVNLPVLADGSYTVFYRVISADGHPISQSYLLSIGNTGDTVDSYRYVYDANHAGPFFWLIKAVYYFSLLAFCGFILWQYIFPIYHLDSKDLFYLWFKYTRRIYFSFLLLLGFIQSSNVWEKFGIEHIPDAFFHTIFGLAWCVSFGMVIISFILLGKHKWLDFSLVFVLLGAEAFIGHAVTFEPVWISVVLDYIHLSAASIWLGGLVYLLFLWKGSKEIRTTYLQILSRYSFWSMVALTGTGIILTLVFLPTTSFLFHTLWGIMIIVKMVFVIGVMIVAVMVRKRMRQGQGDQLKSWLRWDYRLLAAIVFVVGILTDASPIPSNDPLIWRDRQSAIFMDMEITPNNPGVINTFNISLTMPKDTKVKNIDLRLVHHGEEPAMAPITVPLTLLPQSVTQKNRYSYYHVGPVLSLPGTWSIELNMMNQEDQNTRFSKEMTIYPILKN